MTVGLAPPQPPKEPAHPDQLRLLSRVEYSKQFRVQVITAAIVLMIGCGREAEWTDLRRDNRPCVVAVFRDDVTADQRNAFLNQHTDGPSTRRGTPLRRGIGAVIKRDVQGHIGYEICFSPNADPRQRTEMIEGMKTSPVLDRLLEGQEAEMAIYGKPAAPQRSTGDERPHRR